MRYRCKIRANTSAIVHVPRMILVTIPQLRRLTAAACANRFGQGTLSKDSQMPILRLGQTPSLQRATLVSELGVKEHVGEFP